jgi:hypothetical protein
MTNLVTVYLPTFSPVNDVERIAALASSNLNCLAMNGEVMSCAQGGTGLGQHQSYATPTGATVSPAGGTVVGAVGGATYVALNPPTTFVGTNNKDVGQDTGLANQIYMTTGDTWQKVQLASLGTLTAF